MIAKDSQTVSSSMPRRSFLKLTGAIPACLLAQNLPDVFAAPASNAPVAVEAAKPKKYPTGLELYSVRKELARDLPDTLKAVAAMGYDAIEFYAVYYNWKPPYAKEVRTMMDDLGLRCYSTHNSTDAFKPGDGIGKAIELNQILGAKIIVLASATETHALDSCKKLCEQLSDASAAFKPHGLFAGYHNHNTEWAKLDGDQRTIDVITANTPKEFVLQLDIGNCLAAGADPVAFVNANPGRIRSAHVKDWAPGRPEDEKGFRVLLGEGVSPWPELITALETTGGVDYYYIEQEGSRYSELETARRNFELWKGLRKAS